MQHKILVCLRRNWYLNVVLLKCFQHIYYCPENKHYFLKNFTIMSLIIFLQEMFTISSSKHCGYVVEIYQIMFASLRDSLIHKFLLIE